MLAVQAQHIFLFLPTFDLNYEDWNDFGVRRIVHLRLLVALMLLHYDEVRDRSLSEGIGDVFDFKEELR